MQLREGRDVTLVAVWRKLEGTAYTVRHLELNTEKVLHGATLISGTAQGDKVVAAEQAVAIDGYVLVVFLQVGDVLTAK